MTQEPTCLSVKLDRMSPEIVCVVTSAEVWQKQVRVRVVLQRA